MIAIGLDVSKGKSTVGAVGEGKKVLQKPFDISHNKTEMAKLIAFVKKFGGDTRVVMEHTGVYYLTVAETLCKAGIRVSAVNPALIHQFGDNTLRKVKTDKKDSMKIARYALENRDELRNYTAADSVRDSLKALVRQFEFEEKTLTAHKNSLNALLERSFPGIDGYFSGLAKSNGHQKLIDFVIAFWHSDCVSGINEAKFLEKYAKFCKKNRYCFNAAEAKQIHAMSRENLTSLVKNDVGKSLVTGAAQHVLQLSVRVEELRAQMVSLAKRLPEFETVDAIYGVGETLAAKLIAEAGDVRRFESKRALVAYAGVDPGKNDSGTKVAKSGKITRSGDAILRKAVFQAVDCYVKTSPTEEPVYQFLDKKRAEGKNYFVYMTAACNKFLRIYYARVMERMTALDSETATQAEVSLETETVVTETIPSTVPHLRIVPIIIPDNNHTFTCEQDRSTLGSEPSGPQDFAYTDEGSQQAAL